ncbi:MAG TPA: tRNA pseudouridine(38-40) synthase TruA [Myxococcaceae bacterium]|nr:tRNA pseudouridine(38-40) synthase TruA [Myxococcaceae bacterium]
MPRIQLILEYEGTHYVGWQTQRNGPSVHDRVLAALTELLGEKVALSAAARTDSGVHALGQVVCFDTARDLPRKAYSMGLNKLLPRDIAVVSASQVADDFDPRRRAAGKRYRYWIWNRRSPSPLRRRTHWEIFQPLDVKAMASASALLLGKHDFSAFRASDCQASHAIRELRVLFVEGQSGGEIAIHLEATAFLKHMARNIVGSLVEIGRGRRDGQWLKAVLESKDRTLSGPTAPAHGLTLVEVLYA